jgi:hypothetical protein
MWHDSNNINGFKNFSALSDCSIILYVMTEKWPAGKRYRDLFESVKKSVLDEISGEKHIPRTAVTSMREHMQTSLNGLQVDTATEQMISDMTGGTVAFWEEADINMNIVMEDEDFSGQMATNANLDVAEWEPSDNNLWLDNEYVAQDFIRLDSAK